MKAPLLRELGKRIADARSGASLTQTALAEYLAEVIGWDVSQSYVARLEKGDIADLHPKILDALCKKFDDLKEKSPNCSQTCSRKNMMSTKVCSFRFGANPSILTMLPNGKKAQATTSYGFACQSLSTITGGVSKKRCRL